MADDPQAELCERILEWRPPRNVQRTIMLDTNSDQVLVGLIYRSGHGSVAIPFGASGAEIAELLNTTMRHIARNFPFDEFTRVPGSFVPEPAEQP